MKQKHLRQPAVFRLRVETAVIHRQTGAVEYANFDISLEPCAPISDLPAAAMQVIKLQLDSEGNTWRLLTVAEARALIINGEQMLFQGENQELH